MILSTINAAIHIANATSFVLLSPGQSLLEYFSCSAIYTLSIWTNMWILPAAWRYETESIHRIRMGQTTIAVAGALVLLLTHPNGIGIAFGALLLFDSIVFISFPMLLESNAKLSQQIDFSRACAATISLVLTVTLFRGSPAAYCFLLLGLTVAVAAVAFITRWYRPPPLFWSNAEVPHVARDIANAFSGMQVRALLGARLVEIGALLVLSWAGQIGITIALKIGLAISSSVLANARQYSRSFLVATEMAMYTAGLGGAIVATIWLPAFTPATLKTLSMGGAVLAFPIVFVHFFLILTGLRKPALARPEIAAVAGHGAVTIIHAFDAHAGAQRVAAQLTTIFRAHGHAVRLWLGFGRHGFVSDAAPSWRFMAVERPARRKLIYPLWLVAANLSALAPWWRGDTLWANSIAAVPAAGPYLLLAPRRLVIHLHETNLPRIAHRVVAWAGRRGATLLAVSAYHRERLALDCRILGNAVGGGVAPAGPAVRDRLIFVGTSRVLKGFPLFLAVAQRLTGSELECHAFLAGGPNRPTEAECAAAAASNVTVTIGETRPEALYSRAFLFLQLTDPVLWDETFSLVTAEAVWQRVPVGGGGAAVLPEVAGAALAFNVASRDPDAIAAAIRALLADPIRYAALVAACDVERSRFTFDRFGAAASAIVETAHG